MKGLTAHSQRVVRLLSDLSKLILVCREQTDLCEVLRVHHIDLRLECLLYLVVEFKAFDLINAVLRIAFKVGIDGTEGNTSVDGELLEGHAFLVKQVFVGGVYQLDSSLVVQGLQGCQICAHHISVSILFFLYLN